jgi:hypothetical protein
MKQLGQRVRCELPNRIIVRDLRRQQARARRDRRSASEPLDAVAVKAADPRPSITRTARDAHMAQFRVVTTEHGLAANHETVIYA